MNEIVSIEWLNQNLNDNNLILLDASLQYTVQGNYSEHQLTTIPGARYFDLKGSFSDRNSPQKLLYLIIWESIPVQEYGGCLK